MSRVLRHICSTVAPQTGKMENGVQDAWGDDTGERHPAEKMGQTLEREDAYFFCSGVQWSVGGVSSNNGGGMGVCWQWGSETMSGAE